MFYLVAQLVLILIYDLKYKFACIDLLIYFFLQMKLWL